MAFISFLGAFIALFTFLIFYYFFTKKPFDYLHIKKAYESYPWNWPVLGMLPGLLMRIRQVDDSLKILENSNMTFRFQGPWFVGVDALITVDPDNIHHITSSNFSNYIKGPEFKEIFDVFGDGLLNSDLEQCGNLRKCYQAMLHHQSFQRFTMNTTISKLKNVLLPLFNQFVEQGTVADLQDVFHKFSFDTTLVTLTGSDPRSLSNEMVENEFVKALSDVEKAIVYRHIIPRFLWKLQNWIGLGEEKKLIEANATLNRLCSNYISAKRDEIRKGFSQNLKNLEDQDVLTFFIKLDTIKYEMMDRIDDKFLRDVMLGFIVAGRDTIASTLTWFFWITSQTPQVVTKIRDEINKNLPRTGNVQENLNKLVYLHGALYETMRLYPPIPFQRKTSIKEDVLPSGHKVYENSTIMMFLYAMGRMKAIWGDDAMEYKPERWVLETGGLRHEPSYKFFVFNSGPRTCLGKQLAINQLKIVIVEILKIYDIKVVEGRHTIEPIPGLILHMKGGLRVTLTKRC